MRLDTISIKNFRSFSTLDLSLGGESCFVISENGVGKSSLLEAIARATGSVHKELGELDFRDSTQPIEITAVLRDISSSQQAALTNHLEYQGGLHVTTSYSAVWDPAAEEVLASHGFPKPLTGLQGSSRAEREAIPVLWLPAWRDPGHMLEVGSSSSLLGGLVADLPIGGALQAAVQAIAAAGRTLAAEPNVTALLTNAAGRLSALMPDVAGQVFDLTFAASSDRALLRQLGLSMEHNTPAVSILRQSGGLRQLAIYAFALEVLAHSPDALILLDEPEVALHPQVQRAVVSSVMNDPVHQAVVATHSASVLARADVRDVIRLRRGPAGAEAVRAVGLSADQADTLKRYATADTAEALFARSVIFVEGDSDRIALASLASRLGRDLDAEGVSIVTLGGSGLLKHYLQLLGPLGLGTSVSGLCDQDAEANWAATLTAAGIPAVVGALPASGFFVCRVDLEEEFIRTLGLPTVQAVITQRGDDAAFAQFQTSPKISTLSLPDQVRKFVHQVEYAAPLVAALPLPAAPQPLLDLLGLVQP